MSRSSHRFSRPFRQTGFTLIELLVALGIFLLVCGAAFTLLASSQQRYQTESQMLTSFQEARLGLDQIVRDINDSGYPPPSFNSGNPLFYAVTPFAWGQSSGYYNPNGCQLGQPGTGGGTCFVSGGTLTSPGDFDLIIETNPISNPSDPTCASYAPNPCPVQWIRYALQGTTLMRGAAFKPPGGGGDPATATAAYFAPFVQNVVNNNSSQIALYRASYPSMFPGAAPVPIFTYNCDTPTAPLPPPTPCYQAIGPDNSPSNIREVNVTLIVAAPSPDDTSGQPRLVELDGRGRRVNPNQNQ